MFHVRRIRDREERSIHMHNTQGLASAKVEAELRTQFTGEAHEVVNDESIPHHAVYPSDDPDAGAGYYSSVSLPVKAFITGAISGALVLTAIPGVWDWVTR